MNDYTECVACGKPVDYCPGGHGAPCEWCNGYESAHNSPACNDATWSNAWLSPTERKGMKQ